MMVIATPHGRRQFLSLHKDVVPFMGFPGSPEHRLVRTAGPPPPSALPLRFSWHLQSFRNNPKRPKPMKCMRWNVDLNRSVDVIPANGPWEGSYSHCLVEGCSHRPASFTCILGSHSCNQLSTASVWELVWISQGPLHELARLYLYFRQ